MYRSSEDSDIIFKFSNLIAPTEIEPAPSFGAKIRADFIQGMGKVDGKFVIILNVDHVLSLDEMSSLAGVGASRAVTA